jgi:hypothetical protein
MASQVLSGATNASYTNNTGQNVRLIINYMSNVTSMTWAGVNVTASATTIGKDIQNITGELRQAVGRQIPLSQITTVGGTTTVQELEISNQKATLATGGGANSPFRLPAPSNTRATDPFLNGSVLGNVNSFYSMGSRNTTSGDTTQNLPNLFYVPLTVSRGGNFPVELMLAPTQSFSAVCGAFNAIIIKEDGT